MANDLVVQVETDEYNALLTDANRYRWLRERHDGDNEQWFVYGGRSPGNLDADIDAEMQRSGHK